MTTGTKPKCYSNFSELREAVTLALGSGKGVLLRYIEETPFPCPIFTLPDLNDPVSVILGGGKVFSKLRSAAGFLKGYRQLSDKVDWVLAGIENDEISSYELIVMEPSALETLVEL